MQANYTTIILPMTLREEGGKADDKRDPGGRTNKGITQKRFWEYADKHGNERRDVWSITDAEVAAIYAEGYWAPIGGPTLASGPDLAVFDCGVMSGPGRANAFVKAYGGIKKVNASPGPAAMYICDKRLGFVEGLKVATVYGKGWAGRVARIRAKAVVMATHALEGTPVAAPASPAAKTALRKVSATQDKKAASRVAGAKASGVASGSAAVAPVAIDHPSATVTAIAVALVIASALLAAYLAWRATIHKAVAEAADNEAIGIVPKLEPAL